MKLLLTLFISSLLASCVASAASVSGQLKVIAEQYPYHLYEPVEDLIPTAQFSLSGKAKWSQSTRAQWKLFTSGNFVSDGKAALYPARTETFYADIPEAFVEKKFGSGMKLRAGFNTVNWGIVDLYSPMDSVNTSAFFHPLRSIKQGAPMLQWLWSSETLEFDALYIPWQTRPLLPDANSRWLPRDLLINYERDQYRVLLPNRLEYQMKSAHSYTRALYDNAGAKLTAHLGKLDIHATHFDGAGTVSKVAYTIVLDPAATGNDLLAQSPIGLAPVYYRVRTSGLGFVYATDSWIFKNENVYQHGVSNIPQLQKWSWQHVVGAERNWDLFDKTLTSIFQFYYSTNPDSGGNGLSNYFRLFDRTAVAAFRYSYSDEITGIGSALFESHTSGWFFIIGFEQKLRDALSWSLSWRDFSAARDGLLKTYDRNDHATLEMTYSF